MDRINAKGYKPWIRPYIPHCWSWKHGKATVIKKVSPTARQLALMRLGTFSVANDSAKLEKLIDELFSCETTIHEPICAGMSFGEVGDCNLTYADPSRPPPKHGWLRKAMRFAAVFFLFLMVLIGSASCKKEPIHDATPIQKHAMAPNDTIHPQIPNNPGPVATMWTAPRDDPRKATIIWNWYDWYGYNIGINDDSVIYYGNQPGIDTIVLMPDTNSFSSNYITCNFSAMDFHNKFLVIEEKMNYLTNCGKYVTGAGTIYVDKTNGAHLDTIYEQWQQGWNPDGMSWRDSLNYTSKNYKVERGYQFPAKVSNCSKLNCNIF